MKKIILLAICVCVCVGVGCGFKPDPNSKESNYKTHPELNESQINNLHSMMEFYGNVFYRDPYFESADDLDADDLFTLFMFFCNEDRIDETQWYYKDHRDFDGTFVVPVQTVCDLLNKRILFDKVLTKEVFFDYEDYSADYDAIICNAFGAWGSGLAFTEISKTEYADNFVKLYISYYDVDIDEYDGNDNYSEYAPLYMTEIFTWQWIDEYKLVSVELVYINE